MPTPRRMRDGALLHPGLLDHGLASSPPDALPSVSHPERSTCEDYSPCRASTGWVTALAFAGRCPVGAGSDIALAPGGRVPARHLARPAAAPRRRVAAAGSGVVALLLFVVGLALAP